MSEVDNGGVQWCDVILFHEGRGMYKVFSTYPESQSTKEIRPTYDDEIDDATYDKIYDVIAVKTVSKCLARMKGCWDPQFEPSVEEIMDY